MLLLCKDRQTGDKNKAREQYIPTAVPTVDLWTLICLGGGNIQLFGLNQINFNSDAHYTVFRFFL